tara:strand:+ start:73 stop:465 length:393 start_codon:yes stop_codon:yes gene_type:complete
MRDSIKDLIGMSPKDIKDKLQVEFLKKYPEAPCELHDTDVDRLSLKHSLTSDKYWRMFAGSSSELLSYKSGVVEIEITTSRQKLDSERNKQRIYGTLFFLRTRCIQQNHCPRPCTRILTQESLQALCVSI